MADVEHILRLMEHAADRLAQEDNNIRNAFYSHIDKAPSTAAERDATLALTSVVAASTYAQTVLRLVASFMTDAEPQP